jgi:plasmid stability protein
MGDMLIRGIPDALKTELEDAARQGGESLSSRAIDLLRKGLLFEKEAATKPMEPAGQALRLIFEEEGAIDDEFVALMNELEFERKKDTDRPIDFAAGNDAR